MQATWLVRIPHHGPPTSLRPDEAMHGYRSGQLPPQSTVSFDGGATWQPLPHALGFAPAQPDPPGLEFIVPVKVQADALIVGYLAIFSLLFFGGPVTFVAALLAWDPGPKSVVRFGAVAVALVLGPLPIALYARLAHRKLAADPAQRGKARVMTAYVCTGLMGFGVVAALVGAIARALG